MKNKIVKQLLGISVATILFAHMPVLSLAADYNIGDGSIIVDSDADGVRIVTQAGVPNDPETTETVITGTSTSNTITINSAGTGENAAKVTLQDVNIDLLVDWKAVDIVGAGDVIIELDGNNIVSSSRTPGAAGIQKEANTGNLTFADDNNTEGVLTVTGGQFAAGIGGGNREAGNNITITGGTITATGGESAAGIGGGYYAAGTDITISGGTINATGGESAAGIGGGYCAAGTNIIISGGTVTATGGKSAAGIGGGIVGNGSNITISGGTVTSIGGPCGGAGIGGGLDGTGSNIAISGPAVVAVAGSSEYRSDDVRDYWSYGAGAAIGNGTASYIYGNPTAELAPGTEVAPDTSGLYNTGSIKYFQVGTTANDIVAGTAVQIGETIVGTIEDPNAVIPPNPSGQVGIVTTNNNDSTNNTVTGDTSPVDAAHAFVAETDAKLEGYINNILALIAAGKIEEANTLIANGILLDTGRWHTFNKDTCALIEKASLLGIKVTLHYEYDHTKYSTTIPAKTTINPVSLCDENGFVGFMNFLKHYGGYVRK